MSLSIPKLEYSAVPTDKESVERIVMAFEKTWDQIDEQLKVVVGVMRIVSPSQRLNDWATFQIKVSPSTCFVDV